MNKNIRDYINLIENAQIGESEGVAKGAPKDPNAPKLVQDRKTGKWYDPQKEFAKKMNSPEVQAQMKRMTQKEGVAEGYTNDDIETTRQFRNAIAGLKARSAIDKAKDGAGARYYADGAKVTPQETARRAAERKAQKDEKGVAEGSLNEFAPDGFNSGDDDEGFSPEIAKMAQEDGFTKGAGLADGATLERAMAINHWHSTHGGMYKQYFAKGFKAGRMDKIRHNNKQYNLNLKLMKDGSIRHGEQK